MGELNWAKLVAEGRAKAFGIPWSEEERNAVYLLKIPAVYVREGIATLIDYSEILKKEIAAGKKPLHAMEQKELIAIAEQLGIKLTPEVPKDILITEITKRRELQAAHISQLEALDKTYQKQAEEQIAFVAERIKQEQKIKEESSTIKGQRKTKTRKEK